MLEATSPIVSTRRANDTAREPAGALAVLRHSPIVDTAHPALANVDRAILATLAAGPNHFTPAFIDITVNEPAPTHCSFAAAAVTYTTPDAMRYSKLADMFVQVSAEGLSWTIGNLSSFTTRYYRSTSARDPALWLQSQFADIMGTENVVLVENPFNQPNGALPREVGR
ncbi:hypothetical protein AURDEDRAFT_168951 [Auricularia subglabra TFB-10046 SS5]|nr:hypothetical protein AURDEDRAFT_168951 [Auricularia subglabra TFB-10046 SS5]